MNSREVGAGSLFIAIGVLFGAMVFGTLPLGTAFRMGPGYFPLVLATLLVLVGIVAILRGRGAGSPITVERGSLRGIVVLTLAPILFGLLIDRIGLVGTTAGLVLVSSAASRKTTFRAALMLTAALTAFSIAVFHYGLNIPVPLFGTWLRSGS